MTGSRPAASAEADAAWPGVEQGFSSQYRLGHHSGWNAAVAALSRSTTTPRRHDPEFWADCAEGRCPHTTTPDATDAAWGNAAYASSRTHGVHNHDGGRQDDGTPPCREYVTGKCLRPDATDAGSRDTLQEFGTAVGLALSERKVAEDLDADNLTFPQMVEATCGLLDRLDDAMDAFLAARGADHKTDRQMQRDLRDALAAPSTPTTEGLDIEELAAALYETDPPESWMRTGTDEYRKRAAAMLDIFAAATTPTPDATDAGSRRTVTRENARWLATLLSPSRDPERQAEAQKWADDWFDALPTAGSDATDAGSREALLRLAVRDLHRWDVSLGFGALNTIIGRLDDALAAPSTPTTEGHACNSCAQHDESLDEAYRKGVADASTPTTEGLDEERLADAMRVIEATRSSGAYPHLGQDNDVRRFANDLAEHYAVSSRLSEPE